MEGLVQITNDEKKDLDKMIKKMFEKNVSPSPNFSS